MSFENPMLRPLSESEEYDMLSEDDIKALPDCSECGEKVFKKYKNFNMHKHCWLIGKAEHEQNIKG